MAEYEKVIAVTEKVTRRIKQVSFCPIRFMLLPNSSQRDFFDVAENFVIFLLCFRRALQKKDPWRSVIVKLNLESFWHHYPQFFIMFLDFKDQSEPSKRSSFWLLKQWNNQLYNYEIWCLVRRNISQHQYEPIFNYMQKIVRKPAKYQTGSPDNLIYSSVKMMLQPKWWFSQELMEP